MIGRNSAVAEVGVRRRHLRGVIAFVTWLAVHVALLTNARAKIEAVIAWAWDYFARVRSNPILDLIEQTQIDWNDDEDASTTQINSECSVGRAL